LQRFFAILLGLGRPKDYSPLGQPQPSGPGPKAVNDASTYPQTPAERDRWIIRRRPARRPANPWIPHGAFRERERIPQGEVVDVATLLLTNRECPWRCLMCDLWKTTLPHRVPTGAIPAQIDTGLAQLRGQRADPGSPGQEASWHPQLLKLYNGGSFFDAGAIPPGDYANIAARIVGFRRIVVECHPALVNHRALRFLEQLEQAAADVGTSPPKLEVAMGLETVHPQVLERLNKRMTTEHFARAAGFLSEHDMDLRVFILVQPPFLEETEALVWAQRSVDFALRCGASVLSLIPVRKGNGALEALEDEGAFTEPRLATFESAVDYGIGLGKAVVLADLWDLARFSRCPVCFPERRSRLEAMNHSQRLTKPVSCPHCPGAH